MAHRCKAPGLGMLVSPLHVSHCGNSHSIRPCVHCPSILVRQTCTATAVVIATLCTANSLCMNSVSVSLEMNPSGFGATWGDSRAVLGLGGWHIHFVFSSAQLCCHHFFTIYSFTSFVGFVPCPLIYNLQWWMSWLEHWWRAQRSVISIVNCRIPWINRILNVFCAFGTFLRACLLQSLLLLLPVAFGGSASCASVRPCVSRNTFSCPWHTQCACLYGCVAQHLYYL